MSISFYVKNKNGLFGSKASMTVKQCLELSSQKLERFSFDEIDAKYIVVDALTQEDILNIVRKN